LQTILKGRELLQEKELLQKVNEWQAKARRETDPFNKYVSVFIAYNIFYNLYARKKGGNSEKDYSKKDSHNATATISLVEADQLFKSIEPDLREYISLIPVFREEYWPWQDSPRRVPIAQTLKESFQAGDSRKTIDMLIKWLYKVRCNLVHGEKSYKDNHQKRLLEKSSVLLDKMLKHMIYRYKQIYGQTN
jgi:hypothetical protein